MNLNNILEEILSQFCIGDFVHPIFYNFKIGLRFEIGVGEPFILEVSNGSRSINEEYINEAKQRAIKIYDAAFAESDDVLIVFDCTPSKEFRENLHENVCRQRKRIIKIDEDNNKSSYYRYLYKMSSNQLNKKILFEDIIRADYIGKLQYTSSIYMFNLNKQLLYHLYDDRGLDIIATKVKILKPIYEELNDMLLDYDREKMNDIFGSKGFNE